METAKQALERLKAGNRDFALRMTGGGSFVSQKQEKELPQIQDPFAIILSCSDARAPAEIVFNQGLGDLFVIRVAGNIVAPSQVGSVEYAAALFNARLVVVMGHTHCGAILATLDELQQPTANQSPNLRSIVDRVRPSVEVLLKTDLRNDKEALVRAAVQANVSASVNHLRHGSALLETIIQKEALAVVGAVYSLETGVVDFFDVAGAE